MTVLDEMYVYRKLRGMQGSVTWNMLMLQSLKELMM